MAVVSNPNRTPVEPPSTQLPAMEFARVKVFATRDGDRVTGRVEFPYEVCGRSRVPIDYRSKRPDDPANQSRDREGADRLDPNAARRLELVRRWQKLCNANLETSKKDLAARLGVGVRSLQIWSQKLKAEGPAGLRDRYVKPPKRVLSLDANTATDALLVCAWWCFRIGNVAKIDTKIMWAPIGDDVHPGPVSAGYPLADILATIDAYYGARIDRQKFPFKRFSKWCRYPEGFRRWVYLACDQEDYRMRSRQLRAGQVAYLKAVNTREAPQVTDAATRRRQVLNHATRSAIRSLVPNAPPADQVGLADCATDYPATMAQALWSLPDNYRMMLFRAASGDPDARREARLTMPVWYPKMPSKVQAAVDGFVKTERAGRAGSRRPMTDEQAVTLRLQLLLPRIRDHAREAHRLGVAARIAL